MTAPPDRADIAEATAAGKWLAVAAIAAAAGLALVFWQYVWPVFEAAFIAAPDVAAVSRLRIAAAGLAAVGVACAAYLLHYGRAVLASGRNPPPAARLWRATRIVRGNAARRVGVMLFAVRLRSWPAWACWRICMACWPICLSLTPATRLRQPALQPLRNEQQGN